MDGLPIIPRFREVLASWRFVLFLPSIIVDAKQILSLNPPTTIQVSEGMLAEGCSRSQRQCGCFDAISVQPFLKSIFFWDPPICGRLISFKARHLTAFELHQLIGHGLGSSNVGLSLLNQTSVCHVHSTLSAASFMPFLMRCILLSC